MVRSGFSILSYTGNPVIFSQQPAVLKFMDYGLNECTIGLVHDHTKHIAQELWSIVYQNGAINPRHFLRLTSSVTHVYDNSSKGNKLSPENHQLVNHYLEFLKPIKPNQDITTLAIVISFTKLFLEQQPLLFARSRAVRLQSVNR